VGSQGFSLHSKLHSPSRQVHCPSHSFVGKPLAIGGMTPHRLLGRRRDAGRLVDAGKHHEKSNCYQCTITDLAPSCGLRASPPNIIAHLTILVYGTCAPHGVKIRFVLPTKASWPPAAAYRVSTPDRVAPHDLNVSGSCRTLACVVPNRCGRPALDRRGVDTPPLGVQSCPPVQESILVTYLDVTNVESPSLPTAACPRSALDSSTHWRTVRPWWRTPSVVGAEVDRLSGPASERPYLVTA